MAGNTIKTRIQLKNDTEENWNKAINFIPLKGEVIIYLADDSHPFSRLKVGDGVTTVINLPFIDAKTLNGLSIHADTTSNFNLNPTFIPNKGDIVIWLDKNEIIEDNTVIKIPGFKVGDGLAYNVDLPFVGDDILQRLIDHINDTIRHITASERQFWNNKINCEDTVNDEILVLNRN